MDALYQVLSDFFISLTSYVNLSYMFLGAIVLLLALVISAMIRTSLSYEVKLLKSVVKLNRYFLKEPYINEDNLIRFNRRMKSVPRTLRYHWQEFMVDRQHAPSEYMNTVTCVDQPIRASTYENTVRSTSAFVNILAVVSFLISVLLYYGLSVPTLNAFIDYFLVSSLIFVLGHLFVIFLRSRQTSIVSDLYFSFNEFERNINKACTTLPQYIDYEVLFTAKEIREGIPVLKEYLEKRALEQKLEQEEKELNARNYENFDFTTVSSENELLLDRAMLESEKYFKVKSELTARIKEKELSLQNYQRAFDEITKDYEKKSQVLREFIQQLSDEINSTTTKLEQSYKRKRQDEERRKLQQVEQDQEAATMRFKKQQAEIMQEIATFKAEIDRRKKLTQDAMISEGKTYAKKIYNVIAKEVQEQSRPYLEQVEETKRDLEERVENLMRELQYKNAELTGAKENLEAIQKDYQHKLAGLEQIDVLKDYLTSDEFKARLLDSAKESELVKLAEKDQKVEEKFAFEKRFYEEKVKLLEERLHVREQQSKEISAENSDLKLRVDVLSSQNKKLDEELKRITERKLSEIVAQAIAKNDEKVGTTKQKSSSSKQDDETSKIIARVQEKIERLIEDGLDEEVVAKPESKPESKPEKATEKQTEKLEDKNSNDDDGNAGEGLQKQEPVVEEKEEPAELVEEPKPGQKELVEEPKQEQNLEAEESKPEILSSLEKLEEASEVKAVKEEKAQQDEQAEAVKKAKEDLIQEEKPEPKKAEPVKEKPKSEPAKSKAQIATAKARAAAQRKPRSKPLKRKSEPASNKTKRSAIDE